MPNAWHIFARTIEEPRVAMAEVSLHTLLPGQSYHSTIFICPACGTAWGLSYFSHLPQESNHVYVPESRHCRSHGGGNPFNTSDLEHAAYVYADEPDTIRFIFDEWYRDPASFDDGDS
jgi:hypothetical protein